jgi:hypothetical protein
MNTQNPLVVDLLRKILGGPCPEKTVAFRVFNKLDPSHQGTWRSGSMTSSEKRATRDIPLAHPVILDERVRELLREELYDGTPGLHPLEVAAFEHIKLTANTASNIRAADSGRR